MLRTITTWMIKTNASGDLLRSSLMHFMSSEHGWFLLRLKTALLRALLVVVFVSLSVDYIFATARKSHLDAVSLSDSRAGYTH
jgi:hypothetical protein